MQTREQVFSSTAIITAEEDSVKVLASKKSLDEVLEMVEPFIQFEVDKRVGNLSPEKVNEIKQNVRVKLWHALEGGVIQYPFAYTQLIIRSVFGDLGRERQFHEFSYDEYGEVSYGKMLINRSEGWDNPEEIVLQEEAMRNRLRVVIKAIARLPVRTRIAMICSIFERVDDAVQLKQVFDFYHVPIEMEEWPTDPSETQKLKALLSSARRKIARFLSEGETIEKGDAEAASPFSTSFAVERQTK